jgi:3-hydroxyisobutyrate dehydrogenase
LGNFFQLSKGLNYPDYNLNVMNTIKLGWAGLGNMGNPMVKNLLKAGYPVSVWNRTPKKEKEATEAGATAVDSPRKLTEASDIILVMVSNDQAVKEIFIGTDGLLATDCAGKLFINISTVSPDTSKIVAEECRKKNAGFVEAPVSGSVKPAQDATLIILAGGADQDFEKAKPVLEKLGKMVMHLGPVGAGSAAKLAINYLLGLNLQGLAETVLFAKQNGVNTEDMLTIINEGAVGNGITKGKSQAVLNNQFPAAFALKHLTKDLRLAREQGLRSPLSEPLYNSYKEAMEEGLGEEDAMAIMKYLDK